MADQETPGTYRCASCGGEFEFDPEWQAENAATKEAVELWGAPENVGEDPASVGYAVVCDTCFKRILPFALALKEATSLRDGVP